MKIITKHRNSLIGFDQIYSWYCLYCGADLSFENHKDTCNKPNKTEFEVL